MKLLAILSTKAPKLGYALNGLSHITLGLGSRVVGRPAVDVIFGDDAQTRAFRTLAAETCATSDTCIFADFPNTMTGGDSDAQLALGASTPEPELHYLASVFIGKEIPPSLELLAQNCSRLKEYQPLANSTEAAILPAQEAGEASDVANVKISMLINGKLPEVLNQMVLASLALGRKVEYSALRLLDVPDGSGNVHPYISYHPYTIVKANPANQMAPMSAAIQEVDSLASAIEGDAVAVAFGPRDVVEGILTRDRTRLFGEELGKKSLTPVAAAAPEKPKAKAPRVHPRDSIFAGEASSSESHAVEPVTPQLDASAPLSPQAAEKTSEATL